MTKEQIARFLKKIRKGTDLVFSYKCGAICRAKFVIIRKDVYCDKFLMCVTNISPASNKEKRLSGSKVICPNNRMFDCRECKNYIIGESNITRTVHMTVLYIENIDWVSIRNSGRILLSEKI